MKQLLRLLFYLTPIGWFWCGIRSMKSKSVSRYSIQKDIRRELQRQTELLEEERRQHKER